ncbi:MAG: AMP-binding protein, partial [Acidobacteria bacterium]|nr:AMP-binding protein [Acidobacteriota bacterium]
ELWIGGAGVTRGYWNRADMTAERFVENPFAEGRMYRTGDLVNRRADGKIDFIGRADGQVKLRGFRIELGEIEAALLAHPAVSEAVVTTRQGPADEEALVAYVAAADLLAGRRAEEGSAGPGREWPAAETLRAHLRSRLPEFMVPGLLVVLPALPLLPNGKVDRKALAALDVARAGTEPATGTAPRTELEERLAAIFGELLGHPVGIEDDFFRGGGHSLLATRLVARVREAVQVDLPLSAVFEAPTVAALGRCVEEARSAAASRPIPRRSQEGEASLSEAPLSEAQRRLWFLDRLDPGNPAYNLPAAVHLAGPLDPAALDAALAALGTRHETLRSSFHERAGEPVVRIVPPATGRLPVIDLTVAGASEALRAELAGRLAERFARRSFDLGRGPLWRTILLRRGRAVHTLLVALHHVVADGWSVDVFQRELSTLYRAEVSGEPAGLPALPIQYGDYAAWQRERLASGALDTQLDFWRRRLDGAPPALDLPTDRPRPPAKTYAGTSRPVRLGRSLIQRLEARADEAGTTPFALLLAAWSVILAKASGQRELVLGTPIANRDRVEVLGLVGFFVNTLPLRLDLGGDPSFAEHAATVRAVALEAFAHPEVPFERLIEELQPVRDGARDPLVQAVFVLQEEAGGGLDLGPMAARVEELTNGTAKFELTLFLETRGDGGLGGRIEVNRDLFDASRAARLVRSFAVLLDAALASPETPLSRLPWLAPEERHQLLVEWRRPAAETVEERSVGELFHAAAAASSGGTALAWDGGSLSYSELAARVRRLARHLRGLGVTRGDRVAVCAERSPELVVALLAVLEAGAAYLPLNAGDPVERLALMLDDTGADLVLTTAASAGAIPEGRRLLLLDRDADTWRGQSTEPLAGPGAGPDDLAYIAYTSGST